MSARTTHEARTGRPAGRRAAPARPDPVRSLLSSVGNTGVARLAEGRTPVLGALLAHGAGAGNQAVQRMLEPRGERTGGGRSAVVQRQGGYIPDIDGPYGHEYSDGPSTAGVGFSQQAKNDILGLNANRGIDPEQLSLVHISDEDDDQMLTRDRTAVAEVDHIYPRALGGSSSHRNAAVISADSNTLNSAAYPKTFVEDYTGARVLMGHAAYAQGHFRGRNVAFPVPAYQQFRVRGSGPGATINMSDYVYNVSVNGGGPAQSQGPANMSPAEARTLGILPAGIPDPQSD